MISFRYHVVTIVAVFVALAVGILMGSTLLDQGLVNDYQHRTTDLAKKVNVLTRDLNEQQRTIGFITKFGSDIRPQLIGDQLVGTRVVVVTEAGVNLSDLNAVRQTLTGSGGAGATIDGVLVLGSQLSLDDDQVRQQVAGLLGRSSSESATRLADALARALAQRLVNGAPAEAGSVDLLQELVGASLVALSDAREGATAVGGAGVSVVILSGTTPTPVVSADGFLVPLIQELVTTGTDTAAVEPSTTASSFLDAVRGDGQVDGSIITVDNIEMVPGQVALVWGLEELAVGKGGGDYGLNCGSCSAVPSPPSTP